MSKASQVGGMNCKMSIMVGKYIASSEDEFWQCSRLDLLLCRQLKSQRLEQIAVTVKDQTDWMSCILKIASVV